MVVRRCRQNLENTEKILEKTDITFKIFHFNYVERIKKLEFKIYEIREFNN